LSGEHWAGDQGNLLETRGGRDLHLKEWNVVRSMYHGRWNHGVRMEFVSCIGFDTMWSRGKYEVKFIIFVLFSLSFSKRQPSVIVQCKNANPMLAPKKQVYL
jgi:hypothetical protein